LRRSSAVFVADERFKALHTELRKQIGDHVASLLEGETAPDAFGKGFYKLLKDAYDRAAIYGKMKATGIVSSLESAEIKKVDKERWDERKYVNQFIADLEGKYKDLTPEALAKRVAWRADMYADALRGVMNDIWLENLPDDTLVEWVMSDAEHCKTCIAEAGMGARLKSELTRVPGDGSTDCKTNCQCHLEAHVKEERSRITTLGVVKELVVVTITSAPRVA
jgi:hypothetical protein